MLFVTLVAACNCQAVWSPSFTVSQYHAQDELGQASFGYSHPGQAASNFRDAFGNQIGSWAYIDPEGKEVRVSYVADSNGFRVLSNALPVAPQPLAVDQLVGPSPVTETAEVQEAKRAHFAAVAEAKARNAAAIVSRSRRSPHRYYSTKSKPVVHHQKAKTAYYHQKAHVPAALPIVQAVAPVQQVPLQVVPVAHHAFPAFPQVQPVPVAHQVQPVPVAHHTFPAFPQVQPVPAFHQVVHHAVPEVVEHVQEVPVVPAIVPSTIISKYHSQDELGQASFGHVTPDQSASNFRDADGNQMGHYAYINPDGQQIVVYYTAGVGGFRVLSNALPEAPSAVTTFQQQGPAVVQDTDEVAEARRAHLALFEEARNRIKTTWH